MNTYTQKELNDILAKHELWLDGQEGGQRAVFKDAILCGTVFTGADLRGAIFTGTYLCDADFTDASLWNATGNGREIKSLQFEAYNVVYTADVIQIGCKQLSLSAFNTLTRKQAYEMDGEKATEFYDEFYDVIKTIVTGEMK